MGDPTDPGLAANVSNAEYGQEVYIRTTLAYDATGKVSLNVAGNSYEETISTGSAEFMIGGLNAGNYDAVISYAGDSNYNSAVLNVSFTVNKCTPILDLNVADIGYLGESLSVFLTITNSATGNITIMVADKEFTPNIESGSASLNLTGLDVGFYNLTATYNGDLNHNVVYDIRPIYIVERYSFGELELLIRNAVGTLTLDHDYTSDGYSISVTKPIAINGNGYKLDAKEASAIFDIDADNCIIANLTLCNVRNPIAESVYIRGSGCKIENCTIENITGGYAAIHLDKSAIINNVVFNNISTTADGGAIYILGSDCVIANSTFICCSGENGGGGAIFWDGLNGLVKDCAFNDCWASFSGGAIYWSGGNGAIENSIFMNGRAYDGGAVYCIDASVSYCTFIRCSSSENGGAVYFEENSSSITNSIFIQNNASDGGAVWGVGNNVSYSQFIENNASDKGGAIYNCTYVNCNFTGNSNPEIYPQKETPINITASNIFVGQEATIIVSLLNDINSTITITVGGENYTVGLDDKGTAKLNIAYLTAGNYTVTAWFNGTAEYSPNSNSTYFTVSKKLSIMNVTISDASVGDNVTAYLYLPDDATGIIDVYVAGKYYSNVDVVNGEASVLIPCTSVGTFELKASYLGDDKYEACNSSESFTISKGKFPISVTANDCTVGQNLIVNITIPSKINCTVNLRLTGNGGNENMSAPGYGPYTVDIINGKGSETIFADKVGLFNVSVNFAGNDNYMESVNDTVKVMVNTTGIIIVGDVVNLTVTDNITINSTKKGEVEINVTTVYGTVNITTEDLKDKLSVIYKNGNDTGVIEITEYEIKNGILYFTLKHGNFTNATLNIKYNKTEANVTLNRIYNARIDAVNTVNEFKSGDFTFRLVDVDDGSNLAGKSVSLRTAGNIRAGFSATTDSNGIVSYKNINLYVFDQSSMSLNMKSLEVGNCSVELVMETWNHTQVNPEVRLISSLNTNLTIIPAKINIDVDLYKEDYGNDVNITITVTYDNGEPVQGIILKLYMPQTTSQYYYRSTDSNGSSGIFLKGLAAGNYDLTVSNNDTVNILNTSVKTTITIVKPLNVTTLKNADEGYIQVTVPTDITETLTLAINGEVYTINPGGSKIDLTHLNTGNYAYTISYPGDDKYKSYNSNGSIHLIKTTPELNITAKDTTYGRGGNITVLISDDVTGAVNFTVLNEDDSLVDNQIVNVANGAAVYMIPELNVGKYKLNAQATGDSKYYKSSLYSASFNVAPKISITPDVIIGDDGIITMELGNVSGIIAVSVDGELDGSKRIADGKFIYALSTWVLLVGNHTLTFQYSGNSFDKNVFNYWDNETSTYKPIEYKFNIAPKQTETKSDSDNDNLLEIVLEDDKGNVLSNATGKIEFEIINQFTKEVQHVVVDVVNGIAVLDISQFKDGDYMITWNYLGDDKHTPIAKQLSLTITHKPSRIGAADLTILYTSTGRYSVTVYTSSGEAMNNVPVTFLINNRIIKTVTTDSRGVASIPVSGNLGSYHITARADSISVTRTLTVNHLLSLKTVKVKSSAKKLVLTASLKKVNGKFLKGKKITFKFNGKAYSAKTNKKGVAKVTVKSNVLKKLKAGKKVTYQATYLKDTVKKSVKVKK